MIVIFPVKRDLTFQCFYTRHWLSFLFPQTIWFYSLWCDRNSLVYSYQFHLRPRCCGHHFGALVYTSPKLFPGDVFPGKRQNLMCHTGTYICIIISLMIPCQSYHWAILQYSVLFQYILLYMYMAFTSKKINGCWKQNANSSWWWINCINYWYIKVLLIKN